MENGDCLFRVWAPFAQQVEVVVGDGARRPLIGEDLGYWSVTLPGVQAGAPYSFMLDGKKKLPDPASRFQPWGVHKPSAVTPAGFAWTDNDWKGLPMSDMIIYELHVGTFSSSHDFEGVIAKLPYLRDLGITAIELMPVAQFPGDRNWGYDGVFPFAVQSSYGGPSGLKKLVNAAHHHGIAVILDVVYNHLGPEGNYLREYGPYFTDRYKTGWGQAMNFDDAWCFGVRNFFRQNASMWLNEFRIDGLRLDAVHAIWDYSAQHMMEDLVDDVRRLEKVTGRRKVLIAEFDLNNPRYIIPRDKGGYGLDGQWIDEFHHSLHALVTGEVNGYYEDFGETDHMARALKDGYVYTGQFSRHRKKFFGRQPSGTRYDQFVIFAQNHDQIGNRMLGDRLSSTVSFEALKLAACTCLLSPFVPMLFMGEEYGEKNPFQYFISHTDEKLVELVRKGRKQEFSAFHWQGEVPDPQSEKTFEACVLSWNIEDRQAELLLRLHRLLIGLRKSRPALRETSREHLAILQEGDGVVCFERRGKGDHVLVFLNFLNERTRVTVPTISGRPRKVLDSSSTDWHGPREKEIAEITPGGELELYPQSAMAFEY